MSPYLRRTQPSPPPSVRPPTPVSETTPPGYDQAERLRLPVDIGPHRATLHGGSSRDRVDGHRPHPGEVDHDPAIAARQPGDRVSAAPHRNEQVPLPGEVHGVNNVGSAGGSHLERWAPAVHLVVDRIAVEAIVGGREHIAAELRAQFVELVVFDLGLAAVKRRNHCCHCSPSSRPRGRFDAAGVRTQRVPSARPLLLASVVHPPPTQGQRTQVRARRPRRHEPNGVAGGVGGDRGRTR